MWAAFLALTLSAALQALTDHDRPRRAHGKAAAPARSLVHPCLVGGRGAADAPEDPRDRPWEIGADGNVGPQRTSVPR